jgi:predicted nucleic acid-binding protein
MKHMSAEVFIDTNILLYAASTSAGETDKRDSARQMLARPNRGLSVQVLQ